VLDRAALDALSLCKFKPATSNGSPEAGWAQIAYDWKLD
jgi:protein TonB